MTIDRNRARTAFREYTECYDVSDVRIKLKIDHTCRVADIAERIAGSLSLSEEDCGLAWLLGMLHDIGRFEQVTRYGTFNDKRSIDHGDFGADLLFADAGREMDHVDGAEGAVSIFQFLPADTVRKDELSLIETAIRTHNDFRLPDGLDERTEMFCYILRDADKLDIFKVQVDIPFGEIHPQTEEELLTSDIHEEIMQAVCEHRCISRFKNRTAAESYVSHCCLAFELVYPESRRIALEQGYLEKLLEFRSENARTREQFAVVKREILAAVRE